MRTTTDRLDRAALDENIQDPKKKSPEKTATSSKVRVSTRRTNKYPGEADPAEETRFEATSPRSGKYPKKTLRKSGTSSGKYSRKNRRKSGVEEKSANNSVLKSASYWPGNISEEKEKIRGAVPLNSKSKIREDLRKNLFKFKERWQLVPKGAAENSVRVATGAGNEANMAHLSLIIFPKEAGKEPLEKNEV